jgi:hypothetical protein
VAALKVQQHIYTVTSTIARRQGKKVFSSIDKICSVLNSALLSATIDPDRQVLFQARHLPAPMALTVNILLSSDLVGGPKHNTITLCR